MSSTERRALDEQSTKKPIQVGNAGGRKHAGLQLRSPQNRWLSEEYSGGK